MATWCELVSQYREPSPAPAPRAEAAGARRLPPAPRPPATALFSYSPLTHAWRRVGGPPALPEAVAVSAAAAAGAPPCTHARLFEQPSAPLLGRRRSTGGAAPAPPFATDRAVAGAGAGAGAPPPPPPRARRRDPVTGAFSDAAVESAAAAADAAACAQRAAARWAALPRADRETAARSRAGGALAVRPPSPPRPLHTGKRFALRA
jgi:hypothetical protein